MATYVNNLRLTELATGEGSGTWGTTTNTSLELIGEALGYNTQDCFSSDADATTTVADGATDPARSFYFKVTSSATLSATRTLTIAPNTVSRVMFIENATTGSQSITISQGSGANVTIATGKTAVVYLDGAGSGAAVVDAMANVDPGVTDTLAEVLAAGNTSGGTNIELTTTDKVQFRDSAIYLNSSADGQLDIVADTEVQIAATTIDINGNVDISGTAGVGGVLTANAGVVVDNITIDGTEIDLSSGDLTLDVAGNIILDADGGGVALKDGGVEFGLIEKSSSNIQIYSTISDGDIVFKGYDSGSGVTALTLDMSAAGQANFNSHIKLNDDKQVFWGDGTVSIQGDAANEELSIGVNNVSALSFSSSAAVFNEGSGDIDFRVESNNNTHALFVDAGNDRVGVLTNSPAATLHVSSSSAIVGLLESTGSSAARLYFDNTGMSTAGDAQIWAQNNDLVLNASGSERMRVSSAGIDVTGTAVTDGLTSAGDVAITGSSSGSTVLTLTSNALADTPLMVFQRTGGAVAGKLAYEDTNTAMSFGTTTAHELKLLTSNLERLQIDSSGNFIFNELSADADFRVESNGSTHMLYVDAGSNRVGINDTSPDFRLDVLGGNGDQFRINNGGERFTQMYWANNNASKGAIWVDGTDSKFEFYAYAGYAATIHSNATERAIFKSTGEVVFNENSNDYDFRVESDSNTHALFVDAGNNRVGVGASSPSEVLHVVDSNPVVTISSSSVDQLARLELYEQKNGTADLGGFFEYSGATANSLLIGTTLNSTDTTHITLPRDGTGAVTTASTLTIGGNFLAESAATINSTIRATNSNTRAIGNYQAHTSGGDDINMVLGVFGDSNRGEVSTNTNHTLRFYVNNTPSKYLEIATTGQVFTSHGMVVNEDSNDSDFRVESNNSSHMLFVDAGGDKVGINQTSPTSLLDVAQENNTNSIISARFNASNRKVGFQANNSNGQGYIGSNINSVSGSADSTYDIANRAAKIDFANGIEFFTAGSGSAGATVSFTNNLEIDTTQSVFNEGGADVDFRVESDSNSSAFQVDAATGQVCIGRGANSAASADVVTPFGTYGLLLESTDATVANNEYIDITINTGGGGYQGMMVVANTVKANAGARTQSLLFVAGRGTDGVANVVSTDTGAGAASFTVTFPSNGVARVTNTSGSTTALTAQFLGGQSF